MGMSKRILEERAEKVCTCDGGCCLDPEYHAEWCPVRRLLEESSFTLPEADER